MKIQHLSKVENFSFPKEWYDLADENHFWLQWRFKVFLNQMQTFQHLNITQNNLGVEIGCGQGVLRKQIITHTGWHLDGIDMNIEALQANSDLKGDLYLYNIHERHSSLKEKYDFLFLFDVLEHVAETTAILESCLFHLKSGGYFFINVPALQTFHSTYDVIMGHLRRYNKTSLQEELKRVNLNIIDMRYWGFSMVPLLFIRKLTTNSKQSRKEIFEKGFKPPSHFALNILNGLKNFETKYLKSPLIGSSLMAVGQKQ